MSNLRQVIKVGETPAENGTDGEALGIIDGKVDLFPLPKFRIVNPQAGDVLLYDATTNEWYNTEAGTFSPAVSDLVFRGAGNLINFRGAGNKITFKLR